MRKRTVPLLYVVMFIAGAVAGIVGTRAVITAQEEALYRSSKDRRMSRSSELKLTNPLLECCEDCAPRTNLRGVKSALEKFIHDRLDDGDANTIAVYIRDLNNGPWVGINEKERFSPASLLKIPTMMAYLKLAGKNPAILAQNLVINEPMVTSPQMIPPQETIEVGKHYTVKELIRRMIVHSDNVAKDMLCLAVEEDSLLRVYRDIGIESPRMDDYLTVRDYASFFRILYNASYLEWDLSEWALGLLLETKMLDGIRAGVPESVPVASKFGEREFNDGLIQFHECGIVYIPNSPYILCVMTRGSDMEKLKKIVADISHMVYTFIAAHQSS